MDLSKIDPLVMKYVERLQTDDLVEHGIVKETDIDGELSESHFTLRMIVEDQLYSLTIQKGPGWSNPESPSDDLDPVVARLFALIPGMILRGEPDTKEEEQTTMYAFAHKGDMFIILITPDKQMIRFVIAKE